MSELLSLSESSPDVVVGASPPPNSLPSGPTKELMAEVAAEVRAQEPVAAAVAESVAEEEEPAAEEEGLHVTEAHRVWSSGNP